MNVLNIPGVSRGLPLMANPAPVSYKPGEHVMHRKFGEGIVKELVGSGADARVRIEFISYGIKEFNLSLAPIIKLE
jgi:DNA helicase-2/ATP-dependent DNA helicase PcrA